MAAYWSHPLVLIVPVCATGLAMIAYSLAKYGFGDAIVNRQLLIGLSVGLVLTLFQKWLTRRYLQYYVDYYLGLRSFDVGITLLQSAIMGPAIAALSIALSIRGDTWEWAVFGPYLFVPILLFPEAKALHEGIKAKLAEMENTPEQDATEQT